MDTLAGLCFLEPMPPGGGVSCIRYSETARLCETVSPMNVDAAVFGDEDLFASHRSANKRNIRTS